MSITESDRLFIAGHRGMAGSAIMRRLKSERCTLLVADRSEVDLCDRTAVEKFFQEQRPTGVIFAAAKVGGIHANLTYPADFLLQNVMMASNVIDAAFRFSVRRLLYLGSNCIYPRDCEQPIRESSLLTGPLEKTNEAYALAKIVGLKLCESYRIQHGVCFHSLMPTNLYGPGDNYHRENSHVLPALIRKIHEAKDSDSETVTIWGTGAARREFLHTDDLADAVHFTFGLDDPPDWVNVGTGMDLSILSLAKLIAKVVGFEGEIHTDPGRPEGTPVKCNEMSRLHELGWRHQIDLEDGLRMTYQSFLSDLEAGSLRSF